ncbi:MAG: FHA domain-containing protein [Holosporales bacterium]|jgi:pSer/pThr/pTyr-binding forkhead associated (FHA) protein|nr:FHA domain-containing protein [Holosporales bacterium]
MKVITVGRGQGNTIIINDSHVSRTHLKLEQDDLGNVKIIDSDSANGTFVNGKKLTSGKEVYLSSTDIVRIGNTTLPWKSYFVNAETTIVEQDNKKQKRKRQKAQQEKKPVNFRNVLSIVMTIFSLMFMIMMFLKMLKVI